ncbi:hypothetical protein Vretimale_16207, partial [Volvox reticuliferus]
GRDRGTGGAGRSRGGGGGNGGPDIDAGGFPHPRFGGRGFQHDDRDLVDPVEVAPTGGSNGGWWRRHDDEMDGGGPGSAQSKRRSEDRTGSHPAGTPNAAAAAQPLRKVKAGHQAYTPPARRGTDKQTDGHGDGEWPCGGGAGGAGEDSAACLPPGLNIGGSGGGRRGTRDDVAL